jgi:hypothetical protein
MKRLVLPLAVACGGEQIGGETTTLPMRGEIRILTGAEALAGAPGWSFSPEAEGCGYTQLAPGDVDGDGLPDLALQCRADTPGPLRFYSGADLGAGPPEAFAVVDIPDIGFDSACALGDVDGDGLGDVGLGVRHDPTGGPRDWGLVLPGSAARGDARALDVGWHMRGPYGQSSAYVVVTRVGDIDLDGLADLAVVVDGASLIVAGAQLVGLGSGGATDASAAPLAVLEDYISGSTTAGGDVDGDGLPDVILGGSWGTGAPPGVRVWSGPAGIRSADNLPLIEAQAAFRTSSAAAVGLGDLDGDGRGDVAVRLQSSSSSEQQWDGLAVVRGVDLPTVGTADIEPYLLGEIETNWMEPCDLDGDGLPELLTHAGIWAGADLLRPGVAPVAPGLEVFAACLGDLDGDGTEDVAVGNPYVE